MTRIVETKSIHIEILNRPEVAEVAPSVQLSPEQRANYTYSERAPIGSGTFGSVCKAKCDQTGEVVAIKTVFQDSRFKHRELQILKEVNHPNIVSLIDYFYTIKDEAKSEKYLNVIMNYIPNTLHDVIRSTFTKGKPLNIHLLKLLSYQLLLGLNHLSQKGICHRDIKPQNILVDTSTNQLQICDFGSAKKLIKGEKNITYICSRYYRAPELIFGGVDYTDAIDMWSVGCVICEMVLGRPIFPGQNAADQLFEIIKVLGTPTKAEITKMNADYSKYKFPLIKCFTLKEIFKCHANELGSNFFDLILKMFDYNPENRIKPIEALRHPFFDSIRDDKTIKRDVFDIV